MASKPNIKSSTTHHAEGNSLASPTQTVVGKGIPNPLTAEDLLKILRDRIPLFPPKPPTNSRPWNGRTIKSCIRFLGEMITSDLSRKHYTSESKIFIPPVD